MNWFLRAVEKYATFSGRAQRAEYWYYILFYLLLVMGLSSIDRLTGTYNELFGVGLLSGLCGLGLMLPSVAVGVRRLHDTGRSGWWLLLGLIPLLGSLILLVFYIQDSQPGGNAYGPNPKGVAE